MIDIVITYLNPNDKQWIEDYNYWKYKEIKEGKADINNRQAFGVERTREWDILKYWFRGIENNCKWVNKIFFICQNEKHVPDWLDRNNPKLRIVYHEEYIPKELLPTFNAMTIGTYISNIKDLGEQYILCDDDYFFLNKIEEDRFFKEGKPVHQDNRVPYNLYNNTTTSDSVFFQILDNDLRFEERYMTNKVKYGFYHLPEARLKSFEQKIIKDNEQEILEHFNKSKFRHKSNLCSYIYSDLLKICNKAIIGDPYKNCCYITLKSSVNFSKYNNADIVCFNDTEQLDDYTITKMKLINFLKRKFPNKSTYER